MRIALPLHCLLQEVQSRGLVTLLRDIGFQRFPFMIHSAPEIVTLTADVGYACLRLTKTSSRCHCHCGLRRIDSDRGFLILCAK